MQLREQIEPDVLKDDGNGERAGSAEMDGYMEGQRGAGKRDGAQSQRCKMKWWRMTDADMKDAPAGETSTHCSHASSISWCLHFYTELCDIV